MRIFDLKGFSEIAFPFSDDSGFEDNLLRVEIDHRFNSAAFNPYINWIYFLFSSAIEFKRELNIKIFEFSGHKLDFKICL